MLDSALYIAALPALGVLALLYTVSELRLRRAVRDYPEVLGALRLDRSGGNVLWLFPRVMNSFRSPAIGALPAELRIKIRAFAVFDVLYALAFVAVAIYLVQAGLGAA